MATNRTRPALDDEPLSDADRAAIDRALSEPGITLSADELAPFWPPAATTRSAT